jgi:hypothetical protein
MSVQTEKPKRKQRWDAGRVSFTERDIVVRVSIPLGENDEELVRLSLQTCGSTIYCHGSTRPFSNPDIYQ